MGFNAYLQELHMGAKHLGLKHLWLTLGLGLSLSFAGLASGCPPLHPITLYHGVVPCYRGASVMTGGLTLEKELATGMGDCVAFKAGTAATPRLTAELIRCLPNLIRCGDAIIAVSIVEAGPGIVFRASVQGPGNGLAFPDGLMQAFPNIRDVVVSNGAADPSASLPGLLPQNPSLMTSRIKIILQNNQEIEYDIVADRAAFEEKTLQVVEVAHAARPTPVSRGVRHYRAVKEMEATAYYPGPECTGQYAVNGLTFTGKKAGYGIAAVDPAVIPLGSKLYVAGYGFAAAEDIGGLIKGAKIDLCFETFREAVNYGRQRVQVYILE